MEGRSEGGEDVARVVDDIGGGELDHLVAETLEMVASASVTLPVSIGGMADTAGHLNDDPLVREHEIDPGHGFAITLEHDLALWTRQTLLSQQPEESSLEM